MLTETFIYFLSVLPLLLVWECYILVTRKGEAIPHVIMSLIFAYLLCGMIMVAGLPNVKTATTNIDFSTINFIPFKGWESYQGLYIANIIMFIPFGLLIPILWKKNIFQVFSAALSFSIFIEISQLFNHRATDVDDLIMNTIGGVIGYLLYLVSSIAFSGLYERCRIENTFLVRREYEIINAIVYLSIFFLSPIMLGQ